MKCLRKELQKKKKKKKKKKERSGNSASLTGMVSLKWPKEAAGEGLAWFVMKNTVC